MNLLEFVFVMLSSCLAVLFATKVLFDFVAYCKYMQYYRILNDEDYYADGEEDSSDGI